MPSTAMHMHTAVNTAVPAIPFPPVVAARVAAEARVQRLGLRDRPHQAGLVPQLREPALRGRRVALLVDDRLRAAVATVAPT